MGTHREKHGSCTIEAGAVDLMSGSHWKPWLRLVRGTGGAGAGRTFDGLKPVFGSELAAVQYATELGRRLADEGWHLAVPARADSSAQEPERRPAGNGCAGIDQTKGRTLGGRFALKLALLLH